MIKECVIDIQYPCLCEGKISEHFSLKNFMMSLFYSAGSGSVVQYSPVGGAETPQIMSKAHQKGHK